MLPGGIDFVDVTELFDRAADEIEPGELLFSEGYTLRDAMSAFEIGEPRLDSGFMRDEDRKLPFDPLTPLMPQELCWILDRSFTCEVEWHAGNTLAQTIFTCLYVHHLDDLDPEFVCDSGPSNDPSFRTLELTTVVLRAAVFGLLKCCDLAWGELFKGGLHDGEDWQGEKCDVSLKEQIPAHRVLSMLEEASSWLSAPSNVPSPWREALVVRLALRKTILQLLDSSIFKDSGRMRGLINRARGYIHTMRGQPSPTPSPDSPSALSFDPLSARRLNTIVPLRVLELRSIPQTWDALDVLLDNWSELGLLSSTTNLSTWVIVGHLWLWLPIPQKLPYIRSSCQSFFHDGVYVLNRFPLVWVVDRFFTETIGLSYASLAKLITEGWQACDPPPFALLERRISQLVISYVRGLWNNPPRRRRYLMKSLSEWHALYDVLVAVITEVHLEDDAIVYQIPRVALVWRLAIIREVIFSGFQLNLYSADEKPFAYWYATQVIEAHLACLDELAPFIPEGTDAHMETAFQSQFLTALQIISMALFSVTMTSPPFTIQRMELNFWRRYKWAFRPEYGGINTPVVAHPQFHHFFPAYREILYDDFYSPSDSIRCARDILVNLVGHPPGWAGPWGRDRVVFIRELIDTCDGLQGLPTTMRNVPTFDVSLLDWSTRPHSWFPVLKHHDVE